MQACKRSSRTFFILTSGKCTQKCEFFKTPNPQLIWLASLTTHPSSNGYKGPHLVEKDPPLLQLWVCPCNGVLVVNKYINFLEFTPSVILKWIFCKIRITQALIYGNQFILITKFVTLLCFNFISLWAFSYIWENHLCYSSVFWNTGN